MAFSPRVLRAQAAASAGPGFRRAADPDAELTLAGLLLLAPERAAGLALDPEDFTEPVAAALVRAFVELSAGGAVPTAAVVARAKELHPGVRVAEASQLISRVAALDEGEPLAERVRGLADVRRALEALAARQVEIIQAPDPVAAARAVLARLDGARPGPAAPAGPADDFPEPPDPAAFHGLAGRFVEVVSPYSEADPVALLSTFLAVFGAAVGRGGPERPGPFFPVEADRHHPNLFVGLVGPTARGRKGTSAGRCLGLFRLVDEAFVADRVVEGLSSGEGLIWAVRDPIYRTVTRKGEPVTELADDGVADKRLLVLETEFGGVLKSPDRQGNTLSAVIRRAWDSGDLQVLTKNSPARATGAHIAIVAHITREEPARYLSETEQANGFANRFIWLAVRRARLLPDGEAMPPPARQELEALAREVARRVELARRLNRLGLAPEAAARLCRQAARDLSLLALVRRAVDALLQASTAAIRRSDTPVRAAETRCRAGRCLPVRRCAARPPDRADGAHQAARGPGLGREGLVDRGEDGADPWAQEHEHADDDDGNQEEDEGVLYQSLSLFFRCLSHF